MHLPKPPRFVYLILFLIWVIMGLGFEPGSKSYRGAAESSSRYSLPPEKIRLDIFKEDDQMSITQYYGNTQFAASSGGFKSPWHNGIDLEAQLGSPIYSPSNGRVIAIGNQDDYCPGKSYGKYILIEDQNHDFSLLYAHINDTDLDVGDKVGKGEKVAEVGNNGYATGPHLHLTVFKSDTVEIGDDKSCGPTPRGKDIDPFDYFDQL